MSLQTYLGWHGQIEYAEQQLCHLRENHGYITVEMEVTPQWVAKVMPQLVTNMQGPKLKKISDAIMKADFGPPDLIIWCVTQTR